jgi:hypothetical protein
VVQLELGRLSSDTSKEIAERQAGVQTYIADQSNLTNQAIADLTAKTNVAIADKQVGIQRYVADQQAFIQKYAADLQADTAITIQDKADLARVALQELANFGAKTVADIQADTSLSIADTQALTNTTIAANANANSRVLQEMVNAGNLENIQANGAINTQITQLTNDNKTLLQTSQGAYNLYTPSLQSLSTIRTNPDLGQDQKTVALNNTVATLNEGLATLGGIASIPNIQSTLTFGASGSLSPEQVQANNASATQLYQELLGRPPDPSGLQWASQAISVDGIDGVRNQIMQTPEYQQRQSQSLINSGGG